MKREWGEKKPIIVCDIDGVIATGTAADVYSDEAGWAFDKCKPIEAGIKFLEEMRWQGCAIILHTSRWGDDRAITILWLAQHGVPYDELVMDKPLGDLYVDDKAMAWPVFGAKTLDPKAAASTCLTYANRNRRALRS